MIIGTCHFVDRRAALKYYGAAWVVNMKLRGGEIKLGSPEVKKDERLFVNDEGRYCVEVLEQPLHLEAEEECPNCKCGTLEQGEGELICRGECGTIFPTD